MQLYAGSYAHTADEVNIQSIMTTRTFNPASQAFSQRTVWQMEGELHAADQSSLATALAALVAAYDTIPGPDLIFYCNDGITVAHSLLNAGSTSGVMITQPPSFPRNDGSEWTTWRTYSITAEAEYSFSPSNADQLMEFEETLTVVGTGGPVYGWVELVSGQAERQIVRSNSLVRATQSGSAVGKFRRPAAPAPIFGQFEDEDQRQISLKSPRRIPVGYENFAVSWSYQFTSNQPLFGEPNLWTLG